MFNGTLLQEKQKVILSNDNILLRGTSLRNTPHVYGAVIYTGKDTKIAMNSNPPRYKNSRVAYMTNIHIITLFIAQCIIATICAFVATSWEFNNKDVGYLGFSGSGVEGADVDNDSFMWQWFKNIGAWILIFTNFVPISLLVTLEVVKFS
jgi:phospholipid-transporting ATPase